MTEHRGTKIDIDPLHKKQSRGGARGGLGAIAPQSEGERLCFWRWLASIAPCEPHFSPLVVRVSPYQNIPGTTLETKLMHKSAERTLR